MQPTVTVVVNGLQKIVEQKYEINLIQKATENAPELFNEVLDTVESDFYCFMSHLDNFTDPSCVTKVISRLLSHPTIGIAYCDNLQNNGAYLSPLYFPAFHPNLLKSEIIINSPLFVKKPPADMRFNTSLDLLYFHEYLCHLGRKQFPIHIAHPIFTCTTNNAVNLEHELKKLKQCLSQ